MLSGKRIIGALKTSGIRYILSVPDIVTSDGLLWPVSRDPDFRLVRVCKEDEAVSIAAGLSFGGVRSLVLIQNTGFMDSINAIRVMAVEYNLPICLMVGLQGLEPGRLPAESGKYSVRICPPLADVMELGNHLIRNDDDVPVISAEIERAYAAPGPVAFFLGGSPAA